MQRNSFRQPRSSFDVFDANKGKRTGRLKLPAGKNSPPQVQEWHARKPIPELDILARTRFNLTGGRTASARLLLGLKPSR